jgi:hemerythrin superfamily protein
VRWPRFGRELGWYPGPRRANRGEEDQSEDGKMSDLKGSAAEAVERPDGNIIDILLDQHSRIRELFTHVKGAEGDHKQQAFDELRALLAAHETGEEMVLRPVSEDDAGPEVARARNQEEDEANRVLAGLEKMDSSSAEFDSEFARFEQAVLDHAEHEEREEFPAVREREDPDKLVSLGKRLKAAEKIAPTHPHPTVAGSTAAQWTVGPFASLVDRARDAISGATSKS